MTQQELELPKGWAKTSIGNLISPSTEKFDPLIHPNQIFVGLEHIEKNSGKIIGKGNSKETRSLKTIFRQGDLLYGKLRPYLNKVCIPNFNGVCSTDILVFQKNELIENKFLRFFLLRNDFVSFCTQNMTGTQHPRISYKKISEFMLHLPPLNEQKRIVSKIEELFSKIDSTKQSLVHTKLQLEQYRYSLLKSIFEGKELVKTGEVCEGVVPGRYKPKVFDGDIPWITTPDLDGLYILKSKKNLCVSRKEAKKVGMKIMPKQTVLLTCVGDLGRICITKNEVVPNQQFHGFVCTEKILPEYLAYALTIQIRQMLTSSTATTISYMNKTTCNNLKIPLASSIEEQEQIVSQIEQGFSLIENSQRIVNSTLQTLEIMRMSVLKQAFQGKLVPQDPNDESAEILLERIKKERDALMIKNKLKRGERFRS